MKRLLIIAALCIAAASCSNTFKVDGTVTNQEALADGAFVLAANSNTRQIDTVNVEDGKFHFEFPASDTTTYIFSLASSNPAKRYRCSVRCIAEKGLATIELGQNGEIISAGKITADLNEMNNAIESLYDNYMAKMDSLKNCFADSPTLFAEESAAAEEAVMNELKDICISTFKANKDNALGLSALKNAITQLSLEEVEDLLKDASPFIKENRSIVNYCECLKRAKETAEGQMFVDFEGKSPQGEVSRLSDFVGRGKYVLVDFWASWCGPCKKEIPNIKEMYEKYAAKGLVVLGVAVWDEDNSSSRRTMEELDMKWDQIFAGTDMTPTDRYGIFGIPHIILFGPDGTIVKRDLRGDEMISTISKLYE